MREPDKQATAQRLLGSDDAARFVVSTQVLGEFYVTATRKLRPQLDLTTASRVVNDYGRLPVIPTDLALVRAAMQTAERSQISYWDALIIEAAVAGGCDRVLTEDLAAGSAIRGVEIVNPFA